MHGAALFFAEVDPLIPFLGLVPRKEEVDTKCPHFVRLPEALHLIEEQFRKLELI
jgi:hypothetical protein